MTHGYHPGATVTSTCGRCSNSAHTVLEQVEANVWRVQCGCGKVHRDKLLAPQPGPQADFRASEAEIRIYAGAMGTGKTYALLLDWLVRGAAVPNSVGLICRENSSDITIGGGLWDEAGKVFSGTGENMRGGSSMDARWPATESVLSFRHLHEASVARKKGPGFTWIGIEEATECKMSAILWLLQRMRSAHGIKSMMSMTTNPDPGHPLRQWVDWYTLDRGDGTATLDRSKSGIVRYTMAHTTTGRRVFADTREAVAELAEGDPSDAMSYTVITSLLSDNAILDAADPRYRSKFAQMSPDERAKNLHADWNARPVQRGLLKGLLLAVVSEPLAPIVARARFYDMAHTLPSDVTPNPDYTAGALGLRDVEGNIYLAGLVVCRQEGGDVLDIMRSTATLDGPHVAQGFWVDPSAGKSWAAYVGEQLQMSPRCGPVTSYPCGSKLGQKIIHATPVHKHLGQGKVFILAGPWLEAVYQEGDSPPRTMLELIADHLGSFPSDKSTDKDDIVDAISGAFRLLGETHVVVGSPKQTALEGQRLAAQQRGGLRGGGRRGYGGRR